MWLRVRDEVNKNPHITNSLLARQLLCHESTISRIRTALTRGRENPEPSGRQSNQQRQIQSAHHQLLLDLHYADPQSSNVDIRQQYNTIFPSLSQPHIDRLLKKVLQHSQKRPLRYHPNKLEPSNIAYYDQFINWVGEQDEATRIRFKFFDEVRVDRSNLGTRRCRSVNGQRQLVQGSRLMDGESWTINLMTLLDDSPAFVLSVVPGGSSGPFFWDFWSNHAYRHLHPGDFVFADNMNFHVRGDWADLTHSFLRDIGVTYYRLPKYSPELNPTELVFSKLKRCLEGKRHDSSLITAIYDCLDLITSINVVSFYVHRGYL